MKFLKKKLKIKVSVFETKDGVYMYKFRSNSVLPHSLKELVCSDIDVYLNKDDNGKS